VSQIASTVIQSLATMPLLEYKTLIVLADYTLLAYAGVVQ
jgi:hypothetical protein